MLPTCARNARPRPHGTRWTVTFNLDPSKDVGRVDGPCPAWPWWREWVEEARRQILALACAQGRAASGCPKADCRDRLGPAHRGSHRPAQCCAGRPSRRTGTARQREQLGDLAARRSVVTAGIRTVLERPQAAAPVRSRQGPDRDRSRVGRKPGECRAAGDSAGAALLASAPAPRVGAVRRSAPRGQRRPR